MLAILDGISWENLSFGVAALVVMVYLARTAARMTKDTLDGVTARQTEMLNWFGNHLSNMSSSLEASAIAMQQVADELETLHDDNIEAASLLLEQERLAREHFTRVDNDHQNMRNELSYMRITVGGSRAEGHAEAHYGERGEDV